MLFDAAKDAEPEDLQTVHSMLMALKRKGRINKLHKGEYGYLNYSKKYIYMKKVTKLDDNIFNDNSKSVSIGIINSKLITLVKDLNPNIAQNMIAGTDIIFWKNRIKHIQKHIPDFDSPEQFKQCFENIPSIISNPDFISTNPKDSSISFIKKHSKNTSIAVRISNDGKASFRTMYPLRDSQLNNYIENGRAKVV